MLTIKKNIVAAGLALAAASAFAGSVQQQEGAHMRPTGKGWGEVDSTVFVKDPVVGGRISGRAARTASPNGISYHGGPVMTNGANVYYIWYGDWSTNTGKAVLTDLIVGAPTSAYYNINTTYTDAAGKKVSNLVSLKGQIDVSSATLGKSLTDSQIFSLVSGAIKTGTLPSDPNGVYFVLTSSDVTASSGFCTAYCGWHSYGTVGTAKIKFSFVGNPETRCPNSCGARAKSPNANPGADAMASVIMHELSEAVTDPQLSAWFDSRGYENADKCAWTYGASVYVTGNGASANVKLGGRDFLIQQNWVNSGGGYCSMAF